MGRDRLGAHRAWLVIAAALAPLGILVALATTPRWQEWWADQPWTRPVLVARAVSVTACLWGGAFLLRLRPRNRCGPIAIAVGAALGAWMAIGDRVPYEGWWPFLGSPMGYVLRPLLFWLVLAWPTGHLDRTSRRFFAVYLPLVLAAYVALHLGQYPSYEWSDKPLALLSAPVTLLVWSVYSDIGGLVAATAVLIIAWRRRLRYRGDAAKALSGPGWWAAVAVATGDLVLSGLGPLRRLTTDDDFRLTAFGAGIQVVEMLRWGGAIAILAFGARKVWRTAWPRVGTVSLDAATDVPLRETVAAALRDPGAAVALSMPDGRWVDETGQSRKAPAFDDGRAVTYVVRAGTRVAAVEHAAALAGHPAVLDGAATALGLRLDAVREQAAADLRALELGRLGRELLEAEDTARRRLESELHDGTQQTLVGLAIQAGLASRRSNRRKASPVELSNALADAVDMARNDLTRLTSGRPPSLLAERGLSGALAALVVTAGLPVTVTIDRCDDLAPALQRAVWFTACEALGNALKHASASRLSVRLTRDRDEVRLDVGDNGVGGLSCAPRALAERVARAGGRLDIDSPVAGGTRLRALFPIGAAVAA